MIADVIIALMIERKIKFSSIDPQEYYCKPSILHILIVMANIIFCISFLFLVISDSVLGDAIFITVWYYCIDVYVFTYISFNVPKRNYAIRYIKKIFTPSPRLIQIPLVWNSTSLRFEKKILESIYRKVASSRPVYYSILELFGQRSQYIIIKFPLHKPSENLKTCY